MVINPTPHLLNYSNKCHDNSNPSRRSIASYTVVQVR
jgi:hypothetical protein